LRRKLEVERELEWVGVDEEEEAKDWRGWKEKEKKKTTSQT